MTVLRLIDGIILLVILEGLGLVVFRRVRGRGMPSYETISFLGAGVGLLVALRVLISDGPFVWFAVAMLVSLAMHLWHVRQRWI